MGLHRFSPIPSGRMGTLWTLASIRNAALLEYGCMGHMLYGRAFLNRAGVVDACKLYATHLDETDIALGDTGRLSRAIGDIARRDKPRVLFLLPSAVPEIIGTDIPALCRELQPNYLDMRLLPFNNGGFDIDQHRGIQETLLHLVKTLPQKVQKKTPLPTFNLIGSCADLFRFQADAAEIVRTLEGTFRIKPLCVMTSATSVEQIEQMGGAHVNLVLRREGVPAAEQLQKQFGTPYLFARPYGIQGTCEWIEQVAEITGITPDRGYVNGQRDEALRLISPALPSLRHFREQPENGRLSVGGHADVVKGILAFACGELSLLKGMCWCDSPSMADENIPYFTEEEWTKAIESQGNGLLMASGEALKWAGRNMELQIANPDTIWRLNPYEPPFVGFRGAVHLVSLWLNENLRKQ